MNGRRLGAWGPICAGASLLVVLGTGCAGGGGAAKGGGTGEAVGEVVVGRPLPELELQAMDGRAARLTGYRGKVLLVDVWATWCEPCKEELPMLDGIASRLRGRGVEVLAVSVDQEVENVHAFLRRRPKWNLRVFHDPAGLVAERLQPPTMPTSYIVDREGVVRYVNRGFRRDDAKVLEAKLIELAGR